MCTWMMGLCANKTLLVDNKVWISFNFHVSQILFSFWFFLTTLECKAFLYSQVTEMQAGGWMWPMGCSLPKGAVDHGFHEGRKLLDFVQHCILGTPLHAQYTSDECECYMLIFQKSDGGDIFSPLWADILVLRGTVNNVLCLGQTRLPSNIPIREVTLHHADSRTLAVCCMCEHWKKLLIFSPQFIIWESSRVQKKCKNNGLVQWRFT